MNSKRLALAATLATLFAGSAHAEFLGLLNGRSADTTRMAPLSVEGAFITGDDYQNLGVRVNYQLSPNLVAFGDIGLTEFGPTDADGFSFGGGVFFHLADQQFLPQFDFGVKGSFHTASLESELNTVFGNFSADFDINNISLEALVSGKEPLGSSGLGWYANAGLNILGGDADDTELLLGGGVHMPLGAGEIYGGVDLIDEIQFGVGYRYNVR